MKHKTNRNNGKSLHATTTRERRKSGTSNIFQYMCIYDIFQLKRLRQDLFFIVIFFVM